MNRKPIQNALWIIGCRIIRAFLNLLVTMLTARYFGPSNFGLINYAASIVAFVTPVMQLGLNTILVQELVTNKEEQGKILGTVIPLNLLSSVLSIVGVACFAAIANPGEKDTFLVCVLYSLNLPMQALEMIQYWYQAELRAKYTAITGLLAYVLVSAYRIGLLVTGKSVYWFAVSQTLDYLIIAVVLMFLYPRLGGQKMSFSMEHGKRMLAKSRHYILSAMMVTVFGQTDKIMLKLMVGETAVGYYAAAVTCAGMTGFVFSAIIETARPVILGAKGNSESRYKQNMILLYGIIIYLALMQSTAFSVFAEQVVDTLYGLQYQPTVCVLRIIVWYTTFSYLGAARTIWILGEEKHHILWRVNLCGAMANVVLNCMLIPSWGPEGAALASLATQIFTNVGVWGLIPELRENNKWVVQALNIKYLMTVVRKWTG